MIEVSLYSIQGTDPSVMVGRCVARSRFDQETMGVNVMEFTKGFLRNNLDTLDGALSSSELTSFLNSDMTMTTRDFSSISYLLSQVGYKVTIWNVADDEDNSTGVPDGDIIEWNVIDHNFIQNDYPTATKILPSEEETIGNTVTKIVEQSGLFDEDKFSGVRNPFKSLLLSLKESANVTGSVHGAAVTQVYGLLKQMGIEIFCALSEA
jgi:hypothetical protein